MTLGSANCTNRSFGIDSELNLAWESRHPGDPLERSIARLRASLLSEHAGVDYDPRLEELDGLIERLDQMLDSGTRLRRRPRPGASDDPMPLLQLAFDPEGPLLESAIEELFEQRPADR